MQVDKNGQVITIGRSVGMCCLYIFSMVLIAAGSGAIQLLGEVIPPFELNALRFIVQIIVAAPLVIYHRCSLAVPRSAWLVFVLNMVVTMFFNVTIFTALGFVPLGSMNGIMLGTCIVTIAGISLCKKSERSLALYIASLLSCVGIVLMIQPRFLFKHMDLPKAPKANWTSPCLVLVNPDANAGDFKGTVIGYMLPFLAGILLAFMISLIAKMVDIIDSFSLSLWNGIFGTVTSLVISACSETMVFPVSAFCIVTVFIHTIGATQVNIIEPYCLQYIPLLVVSIVQNTQLFFMLVLQYTLFAHIIPGKQNWVEVTGGVVCFLAAILGPLSHFIIEHMRRKEKPKDDIPLAANPIKEKDDTPLVNSIVNSDHKSYGGDS